MTDIMGAVMRDVLAVKDARAVLLRLCDAEEPVRYSALRRELGLHAQTFKRVLDKLERHGLVGRRLRGPPNNLGHREVRLEATGIGHFWAQRWRDWKSATVTAAKAQHIPLVEP